MSSYTARDVRDLTKSQLHNLIDETKVCNLEAIGQSVAFVLTESFGYWHNRARAKLCRHFKNQRPSPQRSDKMVDAVCGCLLSGNFYEQFTHQVSKAIRFNPKRDLFLRLAQSGFVFARWMELIHDEWVRNLLENNPKLNLESIARTRRLMNEAVRDCLVTGYEGLKNQGKKGSGNTDPARTSASPPLSPPPLAPASARRGAKQLWGLATSEFFSYRSFLKLGSSPAS